MARDANLVSATMRHSEISPGDSLLHKVEHQVGACTQVLGRATEPLLQLQRRRLLRGSCLSGGEGPAQRQNGRMGPQCQLEMCFMQVLALQLQGRASPGAGSFPAHIAGKV